VNIKKEIAKQLGKQKVLGITSATLTLKTPGTRTPGDVAAGTNPTSTSYPCKAFVDTTGKFMDGTLVGAGASKLSILGGSLPNAIKPKSGATVAMTIEGIATTYRVIRVVSDPVNALHECEVSH
jgi:hypothetical protein